MEISEEDEVSWQYRGEGAGDSRPGTRDASKLSNGNYLVTLSDKVVEVMPGQQEAVWTYELDRSINKEFMGAQRLADGSTVVTECGDNPRVCEVASDGRTILAEIPIQPETENSHQQSRMGRKLANGSTFELGPVHASTTDDGVDLVLREEGKEHGLLLLAGIGQRWPAGLAVTRRLSRSDRQQAERLACRDHQLPDRIR